MSQIGNFDKTFVYEERILPLLQEIKMICIEHGMPMISNICVKNSKEGSEYRNEMVSAFAVEQTLADDKIVKIVNVMNGFDVVPKHEDAADEYDFL